MERIEFYNFIRNHNDNVAMADYNPCLSDLPSVTNFSCFIPFLFHFISVAHCTERIEIQAMMLAYQKQPNLPEIIYSFYRLNQSHGI